MTMKSIILLLVCFLLFSPTVSLIAHECPPCEGCQSCEAGVCVDDPDNCIPCQNCVDAECVDDNDLCEDCQTCSIGYCDDDCTTGQCCDDDVCVDDCPSGECCNGTCCDSGNCCNSTTCCSNSDDICCTDSGSYCCESGKTCCEGNCCDLGIECCDGDCCNDPSKPNCHLDTMCVECSDALDCDLCEDCVGFNCVHPCDSCNWPKYCGYACVCVECNYDSQEEDTTTCSVENSTSECDCSHNIINPCSSSEESVVYSGNSLKSCTGPDCDSVDVLCYTTYQECNTSGSISPLEWCTGVGPGLQLVCEVMLGVPGPGCYTCVNSFEAGVPTYESQGDCPIEDWPE